MTFFLLFVVVVVASLALHIMFLLKIMIYLREREMNGHCENVNLFCYHYP